jgi:hypothetical protein
MLLHDTELIATVLQDTNLFLDRLQRRRLLWADVENHVAASHLAESLEEFALVPLHMQAVARLLAEIHLEYPPRPGSHNKARSFAIQASHHRRASHVLSGPFHSA